MKRFTPLMFVAMLVIAAGCTENGPVGPAGNDGAVLDAASGVERTIGEFVAAQGTYCLPDGGGGCFVFVPPLANFLGWNDPETGHSASVDYAGIANAWLEAESGGAVSVGTTITGTVVERPLADGTAHVSVVMHVSNALTWVAADFDFTGTLLFGERAPEVLAGGTPTVGDCQVTWEFTNTAPGAPLPDMMQVIFDPAPGQGILGAGIKAIAFGELRDGSGYPDGTPGKMNLKQTTAFVPGQGHGVGDGFPVEFVRLKAMNTASPR